MRKSYPTFKQGDRDNLNNYRAISVVANVFRESSMINYEMEISSEERRRQTQIAATFNWNRRLREYLPSLIISSKDPSFFQVCERESIYPVIRPLALFNICRNCRTLCSTHRFHVLDHAPVVSNLRYKRLFVFK